MSCAAWRTEVNASSSNKVTSGGVQNGTSASARKTDGAIQPPKKNWKHETKISTLKVP